jgi:hypothetical protein
MAELPPQTLELFQRVVEALRREDHATVLYSAPALLAASQEFPAFRPRVLGWLAQAEMYAGNYRAAGQAVRQALAAARALGDEAGTLALRGLQAQITMRRQMAAGLPAPDLELPDTPVVRANAAIERGDHALGARLAREAREAARAAGDAREEVLALLALARIPGEAAEAIPAAAAVADASNDQNLVTAVAQAAKAAGVELGKWSF